MSSSRHFEVVSALTALVQEDTHPSIVTGFWHVNSKLLDGYSLIYATRPPDGLSLPAMEHAFERGGFLRACFSRPNLYCLNNDIAATMARHRAVEVKIEIRVSFDTQVISYLAKALELGHAREGLTGPVLDFLAKNGHTLDGSMFLFENLERIADEDPHRHGNLLRNLRALESFKFWDVEHYLRTGGIRSHRSAKEVEEGVEETLALGKAMYHEGANPGHMEARVMYATLLGAVEIQFANPSQTEADKLEAFLRYVDEQVGIASPRAIVVGAEFLRRGQAFLFFAKVQKNHPQILKTLRGMAWDLFFLRSLEQITAVYTSDEMFYAPFLLTFDRRFVEVVSLHLLRGLIVDPGGDATAIPETPMEDVLFPRLPGREAMLIEMFGPERARARTSRGIDAAVARLDATVARVEGLLARNSD